MRAFVILALLLIAGCVYYFDLRKVHFSGTSPIAIDVHIHDHASTNIYDVSITNRAACEGLLKELQHASPGFGGSQVVG